MKDVKVITPVITVLDSMGRVELEKNRNVWKHLIDGGIDGIVLFGSTGEFFSIPLSERKKLVKEAIEYMKGKTEIYVGTGSMFIEEVIELSNYSLELGADAVMIIGPYYFNLSNADIISYYQKLAKSISGSIFLYNFPLRTGYDLSAEIILELLDQNKNIVGYKDTVTEMGHTRELIQKIKWRYPNFKIFCGFDENFVHTILSGGDGCIGGLSNLYPEVFRAWKEAVLKADMDEVSRIQKFIDKAMKLYNIGTPFIPILKEAMRIKELDISTDCTFPFSSPSSTQKNEVKALIEDLEKEKQNYFE